MDQCPAGKLRDIDSNSNSKVKVACAGKTDELMRAKPARSDRELMSVTREGRKGAEHKVCAKRSSAGVAVRIAKIVVDAIN